MKTLLIAAVCLLSVNQVFAHSNTGKAKAGCHSHDKKAVHCHA